MLRRKTLAGYRSAGIAQPTAGRAATALLWPSDGLSVLDPFDGVGPQPDGRARHTSRTSRACGIDERTRGCARDTAQIEREPDALVYSEPLSVLKMT